VQKIRLILQKLSRELVACGILVLLHAYSMALTPSVEGPGQLSLLSVSTLLLCGVIGAQSRWGTLVAAMLLSVSVSAAEIISGLLGGETFLGYRLFGALVGAIASAFMLRSEHKGWEMVFIFVIAYGIGLVAYQPVMDIFNWPSTQSSYHLTSAFGAACFGLIVVRSLWSAWARKLFERWVERKLNGEKANASDSN
jgi:uncharacterized membrane protein YeaQ/YmgE (transglycosylase-associated protein family)